MKRIIAIADDLSGAAETAAAFMQLSAQTTQNSCEAPFNTARIVLVPEDPADTEFEHSDHLFMVFDSDSRRLDAHEASGRLDALLRYILERYGSAPFVFLKVDSLLRGHISHELGVLLEHGPVVFAPALPTLGRSTVAGVVRSEGLPLHESSLWSAEKEASPTTIAEAIAPLASELVGLNTVRGDRGELARVLTELADKHTVAICDAETAEDLDIIATAALRREGVQLVGASALGAALFRAVNTRRSPYVRQIDRRESELPSPTRTIEVGRHQKAALKPVLLVVGTASTKSRTQLTALAASGIVTLTLTPDELLAGTADPTALHTALLAGPAAVSISTTEVDPAISRMLTASLAEFIAPIAQRLPLVLTGGETARAVLNALNIHWLEPLSEIEHGAVLSRTDHDTLVVTRPGTFGGPDSLRSILDHIQSYLVAETAEPQMSGKAHS